MQGAQTPLEASVSADLTKFYERVIKALPQGIPLDEAPIMTLQVPHDVFEALHSEIWQRGLRLKCLYDDSTGFMTVLGGPSAVHESPNIIFHQIFLAANDLLQSSSGGKVEVFEAGRVIQRLANPERPNQNIDKMPDGSIDVEFPGKADSLLPGFVMETGYSQSYEELIELARLWLLGSRNEVNGVLLVKLQKPKLAKDFGDIKCWEGYLEVWVRSDSNPAKENGSTIKDASTNNLPPGGEDPTSNRLTHAEKQFEQAADPEDSSDKSTKAPFSPEALTDDEYAPSNNEGPSTGAINAEGIVKSVARVYFVPNTQVPPEDLEFELRIADIIGKNFPAVGNKTLKIDLKELVRHMMKAIKKLAPEVERKAMEKEALKEKRALEKEKRKAEDREDFKLEDDETGIKRRKNQ